MPWGDVRDAIQATVDDEEAIMDTPGVTTGLGSRDDLESRMAERWGELQNQLSSEQFGQMEHEANIMDYGDTLTGDEIVRAGLDSDVRTDWTSPRSQSVPSNVAGIEYDRSGYGDTVVEMNPAYFDYNQTLAGLIQSV